MTRDMLNKWLVCLVLGCASGLGCSSDDVRVESPLWDTGEEPETIEGWIAPTTEWYSFANKAPLTKNAKIYEYERVFYPSSIISEMSAITKCISEPDEERRENQIHEPFERAQSQSIQLDDEWRERVEDPPVMFMRNFRQGESRRTQSRAVGFVRLKGARKNGVFEVSSAEVLACETFKRTRGCAIARSGDQCVIDDDFRPLDYNITTNIRAILIRQDRLDYYSIPITLLKDNEPWITLTSNMSDRLFQLLERSVRIGGLGYKQLDLSTFVNSDRHYFATEYATGDTLDISKSFVAIHYTQERIWISYDLRVIPENALPYRVWGGADLQDAPLPKWEVK